jgi:hypothetical protein
VFQAVKPPVCLLGGWAVYFHVNPGFKREYGRSYIGARDIDIGIHVNPNSTPEELRDGPVGETLTRIEQQGYTKSRFGFVKHVHRETGDRLTEDEAQNYGLHEVFPVYVDIIPDTTELDAFEEAFGFTPPAESLLKPVFRENEGESLQEYVSWSVPETVTIVKSGVLAAMKIRSIPRRTKDHKQVKDIADFHALLWHTNDYSETRNAALRQVTESVQELS